MNEWAYTIAFYILAAIIVVSAIGVVAKKNLVHSALLLALCFIGVSGLYILLEADYLAAVQLLVYSGAVAIIIVLGVMLTQHNNINDTNPSNNFQRLSSIIIGLFFIMVVVVINFTPWRSSVANAAQDTVPIIAQLLLIDYMVAFEAVAVLLLAAMIGAILLARGVDKS